MAWLAVAGAGAGGRALPTLGFEGLLAPLRPDHLGWPTLVFWMSLGESVGERLGERSIPPANSMELLYSAPVSLRPISLRPRTRTHPTATVIASGTHGEPSAMTMVTNN